jgi:hypothetical protein
MSSNGGIGAADGTTTNVPVLPLGALQRSLMERLMTTPATATTAHGARGVCVLRTQYRMHPDISAFPNRQFYGSHLEDGTVWPAGERATDEGESMAARVAAAAPLLDAAPADVAQTIATLTAGARSPATFHSPRRPGHPLYLRLTSDFGRALDARCLARFVFLDVRGREVQSATGSVANNEEAAVAVALLLGVRGFVAAAKTQLLQQQRAARDSALAAAGSTSPALRFSQSQQHVAGAGSASQALTPSRGATLNADGTSPRPHHHDPDYQAPLAVASFPATLAEAVVILTPYQAQKKAIRARMPHALRGEGEGRTCTVDAFQGQEAPAIIFSFVRSAGPNSGGSGGGGGAGGRAAGADGAAVNAANVRGGPSPSSPLPPARGIGFAADSNRLNVALTRARDLCIVLGDAAHLERQGGAVGALVRHARDSNSLVSADRVTSALRDASARGGAIDIESLLLM